MMQLELKRLYGGDYVVRYTAKLGRGYGGKRGKVEFRVTTDWGYPSLASDLSLTFKQCRCGRSDGTVDCKTCQLTAMEMIESAGDALDAYIGVHRVHEGVSDTFLEYAAEGYVAIQVTRADWLQMRRDPDDWHAEIYEAAR